jgi:23S rRNA pseudouridine2605 synthase
VSPNEHKLDALIRERFALSRRHAEDVIRAGEVTVAGVVEQNPARLVDPKMEPVFWKATALPKNAQQEAVYLFHKPKGVVCSTERQKGERLVTDFFAASERVYPAGRLDKDTTGLIIVTNNGDLALELTHPRFMHPKTYRAVVVARDADRGLPDREQIERKLLAGVKLGDGKARAERITVRMIDAKQYSVQLTVREGRHHLVRRMLAVVGLSVTNLARIGIGQLNLGPLKPGESRRVPAEVVRRSLAE